jgi:hypothetical protein
MNNQSYAVLCESDLGLDEFNNPKGKRMLLEAIGENLERHRAIAKAEELKATGKYGDVKVVKLEVCNYIIGDNK